MALSLSRNYSPETLFRLVTVGGRSSNIYFVGLEDHAYFVPTPNIPNQTNRVGGVRLNNNIVRGGINYKIDWL